MLTEKGRAKITGLKNFPCPIMELGWLGCLVQEEPQKGVPDKKLAKYLRWKRLFFSKVSG